MYCPINENEATVQCPTRCCRLYNLALAFLAALILAALGLILGTVYADTLLSALSVLITATVIIFIVFLVTLITRGCCANTGEQ